MDKPDLLAEIKGQLEAYDTFQARIDKAREMAGKFRPEVVEKVTREQLEKLEGVAAALDPLVADAQGAMDRLQADRAEVDERTEAARLGLEELELRRLIGELDDDAFAAESSAFQEAIASADARIAEVEAQLDEFRSVLQGWFERRPAAAPPSAPDDEDLLGELEDDASDAFAGEDAFAEEDAFADEDPFAGDDADGSAFAHDGGRGTAVHASKVEIVDDVSAVFATETATVEPPTATIALGSDDDEVIEADDGSADEGISFGDDELGDLGEDVLAQPPPVQVDASGTAVLIVGEGTEEEHVYPFNGQTISLGRGRDNTVQVKNDSKVSRYHCKLFERDGGYFIEDHKSSNGTLVDGELITEKRLLGGEEIVIGETFFRFRIHA